MQAAIIPEAPKLAVASAVAGTAAMVFTAWIIGTAHKPMSPGEQGLVHVGTTSYLKAPAPAYDFQTPLSPKLAEEFVDWWLYCAMDFSTADGRTRRDEACRWVRPDAETAFKNMFRSPQSKDVGRFAFRWTRIGNPIVQADGTVMIGVSRVLIANSYRQQTPKVVKINLDVGKDPAGLRIVGFKIADDPNGSATTLSRSLKSTKIGR